MAEAAQYTIRPAVAADLPAVLPMWRELYRIEVESGMAYPLRDDAAEVWLAEAERRIGTPNYLLLLAVAPGGELAGFHTAQIRRRPAIYADPLIGSLIEVFVAEAHRGHGLARRLIQAAVEWCRVRGVPAVEGQVVVGNLPPQKMYLSMGWCEDLIQFRYDLRGKE